MALMDEYQIGSDGPWTEREVAHLWRRAGFGALPSERDASVGSGGQDDLRAAVDHLVDIQPDDPYLDAPASGGPAVVGSRFADLPNDPLSDLGRIKNPLDENSGIGHWLYRMRYTSQPLQEQLTLFLHDHMVSEGDKLYNLLPDTLNQGNDGSLPSQECSTGSLAPDPLRKQKVAIKLMKDQNYLFRRTGIDNFRTLVVNITRNPAMLLYLDNIFNIKGRAQENYARELMELFTMGVGNYSERDVREIAKCLTGETITTFQCQNDYALEYGFNPVTHETGDKDVFGTTVDYNFLNPGGEAEAVIDLIMNKVSVRPAVGELPSPYNDLPATAVHMAWKLLRWFVSHDIQLDPPDEAVLELADYMRGTDNANYPQRRFPYDLRATLRKLFLSKFFYDESNRFAMVKTPPEYVITALRALEIDETSFSRQEGPPIYLLLSGMRLFNPPNVAGWNHGQSWLTSGNVIVRYAYAFRLVYNFILKPLPGGDLDVTYMDNLLAANGGPLLNQTDHEGMINYFGARLIQDPLSEEEHTKLLTFLETMPGIPNEVYYRKILGLIHVMLAMPKFQLK